VYVSKTLVKENNVAQSQSQRASQVGNYLGQPIYQTIESSSGTYIFDRIAKSVDGEFPLDQLNKDELLIRPGLIYRPKV
jgi:hypothetical protein